MLRVVTVIQSALVFLFCILQWQAVPASSPKGPGSKEEGPISETSFRWRNGRNLSAGSEHKDSASVNTISPDFMRHYRDRIRSRESRIVQILVEVNDIVHSSGRGNFSVSDASIPPHQLVSIKRRFEKEFETDARHQDGSNRISRTILLPSCDSSMEGNRSSRSGSTDAFRLNFNIVPPRRILQPETIRIKSAHLFLRVKPMEKKSTTKKKVNITDSEKTPNGILKVRIHSINESKPKKKSDSRTERRTEKERKRRRERAIGRKRPFKTITFDRRNSSEWLKIGLLRTAENWYRMAVVQPGLRVTVVDHKNDPVDPFLVFYDFNCHSQNLPELSSRFQVDAEEIDRTGSPKMGPEKSNSSRASGDDNFNFPYLEIVAKASPKKIEPRPQRHLTRERRKRNCHMRSVQISTEDKRFINLTNIIAPLHFKSSVCEGFCPRCGEPSRSATGDTQIPISNCGCRPVKKIALPVVYMDDKGKVSQRNIPNMVVTKCGCSP